MGRISHIYFIFVECSLPGSSVNEDSPGKNTGVGCHALLQGIFPTQGSNPGLPHHRQILYHLSHQGSPRILEWVTYHSSGYLSDPGIYMLSQFSCAWLCETPSKVAHQALQSLGFSRQEHWSARQEHWSAISFSNAWKWKVKVKSLSRVWLWATPWTAAYQAPPSMGFSKQEYWSGLPCPPPGDLPNPGIEPRSPTLRADSLPAETPGKTKNTGVGSLSLLQGNFLVQESNQGLWNCG